MLFLWLTWTCYTVILLLIYVCFIILSVCDNKLFFNITFSLLFFNNSLQVDVRRLLAYWFNKSKCQFQGQKTRKTFLSNISMNTILLNVDGKGAQLQQIILVTLNHFILLDNNILITIINNWCLIKKWLLNFINR